MKQVSLLVFFLTLFACNKEYTPENKIIEDVSYLADDKLEGRKTGTEGEKKAAEYIANRFKSLGLEGRGTNGYFQDFTFKPKKDPHSEVKFTETNSDSTITGRNILGFLDNNSSQTIVIGAHFDHLGYGSEGSLYEGEEKLIHNGADDNGSGTSTVIGVAEAFMDAKNKGVGPRRSVLTMLVTGEEP